MNKLTTLLLSVTMLAFGAATHAQTQSPINPQDLEKLKKMEDSLVRTADSMFFAFIPDTRPTYCERFARQLVRTLKIPNSYAYPFDTLEKLINILPSEDGAFRIFNWSIEAGNIPKRYYGAIQLNQPTLKLVGLNDFSEQVSASVEDSILTGGKWFGALIYRIMPLDVRGQKIYILFGFNNAGMLSNRKVLDPLIFDKAGNASFGAPIFAVGSRANPQVKVKRFVLEYKKNVAATMNWDAEQRMIVFDRLASLSNDPARRYTYVPSGAYDGLVWDGELWHMRRDVKEVKLLKDGEAPDE